MDMAGVASGLTALPQMFYSGFVDALLNDRIGRGSLQIGGSLALAIGPGELRAGLAGETVAIDGTTLVYRWGRPGLESGDWVMKGRQTFSITQRLGMAARRR